MSWPTFSKYELLAVVGRGATGTVYRARHKASGTLVAVKVIAEQFGADPVLVKRLEQEFLAVSRLNHPAVVRGLDFGQEGTHHYLVLELLEGVTLGQRIDDHGRLSEAIAVGIVSEVAHALQVTHQHGLLHRDVKPNNVMLTRDGHVKLTDFGIVKDVRTNLWLTTDKKLLGTPNYMAPEQFDDAQNATMRGDVYGLAATLFTALTGEVPYPGRTALAILTRKMRDPVPSPRQLVPTLSERTERVIVRSLNPDPCQRPASCLEFLQELDDTGGQPLSVLIAEVFGRWPAPDRQLTRERRSTPRQRARGTARYRRVGNPFTRAILVDTSIRGVQLLVQEPFDTGELLAVELLSAQRKPVMRRTALVRWAAAAPSGLYYRIGCSWESVLTNDELLSFT